MVIYIVPISIMLVVAGVTAYALIRDLKRARAGALRRKRLIWQTQLARKKLETIMRANAYHSK